MKEGIVPIRMLNEGKLLGSGEKAASNFLHIQVVADALDIYAHFSPQAKCKQDDPFTVGQVELQVAVRRG
jgi:hypothetical protein